MSEWISLYVTFCTIIAISRHAEGSPKTGIYLTRQGLFVVHSTMDSTVHSIPLNSLEHCICITAMTNIRAGRDSNPVHLSFEPRPDWISSRGLLFAERECSTHIMISEWEEVLEWKNATMAVETSDIQKGGSRNPKKEGSQIGLNQWFQLI